MSSFLKKLRSKPLDFAFLTIFTVVTLFSVMNIRQKRNGQSVLIVNCPGGEYVYDMSINRDIKIKGLLGYSYIKIKDSTAFFTDSPCSNKLCVQCAPIKNNNEWIACMPNQVFIRVEQQTSTDNIDISSF